MATRPATHDAYKLLQRGTLSFSRMEQHGIRIDTGFLNDVIETTTRGIERLRKDLEKHDTYMTWKKVYGSSMNLDAGKQLQNVIYNVLKYPVPEMTASGVPSTDEKTLEKIDDPFLKDYVKLKKLINLKRTHLQGIRREIIDGYLHPSFDLNTVITYRSSSSNPNFQNVPIRNDELAALIRPCFIPRKGHRLVELDFKSAEVRVAACYNKDPNLIRYVTDKSTDMHRDMSIEIFKLTKDMSVWEINEFLQAIRDQVKNKFVFPEFYGSYYGNCAGDLWDAMGIYNLKTSDGVKLKKHLRKLGIKELGDVEDEHPAKGTFLHHLKAVEDTFWGKRFRVYDEWRDEWYRKYQKNGGIHTYTGFWISGLFSFNDVCNYGIQGSSFHCDLWSLNQLDQWILDNNMKTKLIGQIHDSILADCPEDEVDDYIAEAQQITTRDLPKHWDWIIVPMSVEIFSCPRGGSWYEKKKVA